MNELEKVRTRPNPELVEMLERLLKAAEAGVIHSGVFVGENDFGSCTYGDAVTTDRRVRFLPLIAGLDIQKQRLINAYLTAMDGDT